MTKCNVVEIVTPKKFVLNGLWFGSRRSKNGVIWVHGLGGSAFSKLKIAGLLADKNTAVITFSNRGHDKVASIVRDKGRKSALGGAAHEVFTECVDDIQGAINFARKAGVKNVYIAGHSTGCQKSVFWASRKNGGKSVKGIILLAPMSDYSAEVMLRGKRKIARATEVARALLKRGKRHELLPASAWHEPIDAQRFLSLLTGDSAEEIFTYSQPNKNPRILKSVRVPLFVLLAGKDEYGDRSAKKISGWFEENINARELDTRIIKKVLHSFFGAEKVVAIEIQKWIARNKRPL